MNTELSIPKFLLRKKGAPPKTAETAVPEKPAEPHLEPWQLALSKVEPPEFREYIAEKLRSGAFSRQWLVVDERRYHFQRNVDETLAAFHRKFEERAAKLATAKEAAIRRLAAVPRAPSPTKGLIPLRTILAGMGATAPARRHAIAAIDEAKLDHVKYHFPDSPVTLARLRQIVSSYQPPVRGVERASYPPTAVIRFEGKNPKKKESDAFARWELLRQHDKKTVGEFVAAGGNQTTLKNALARGSARLEGIDAAASNTDTEKSGSGPQDPVKSRQRRVHAGGDDRPADGVRKSKRNNARKRSHAKGNRRRR